MNLASLRNKMRSMVVRKIKNYARLLGIEIGRYRKKTDADHLAAIFNGLLDFRDKRVDCSSDESYKFLEYCRRNVNLSRAQLFQDLFVLYILGEKRNGYFVEFGATDGATLNNTLLLEKNFGWSGLVAEPAKGWHASLKQNRNCAMDFRCVWKVTGERLEFKEAGELSTISVFSDRDGHSAGRQHGRCYTVESVSLGDLLSQHDAPAHIDYLSIDTEGSEFTILNNFDFEAYDIPIITVEHNFSDPDRDNILVLLMSKGYRRVFPMFSKWDDWYVKRQDSENDQGLY